MESESFVTRLSKTFRQRGSMLLDYLTPKILIRWIIFSILFIFYVIRVYLLQGFYIISYGLGIYFLNLFIGFLQPKDDMDTVKGELPKSDKDNYRPFSRRVPEFIFWWSATKAQLLSIFLTFFELCLHIIYIY